MEAKKDYMQIAFETAADFCRELGLDGETIARVIAAENSAFFIQAMSMLEATINSGLSKRMSIKKGFGELTNDEVLLIVERMQMGGANNKVEIALACGLISESDKRFIEGMNEVRNLYVHKFQNYGLSFKELFDSLNSARQQSLIARLDPSGSSKKLPVRPRFKAQMLQQCARFYLLSLVHRVMEFRQPKGILSMLGWTPEKNVKQGEV